MNRGGIGGLLWNDEGDCLVAFSNSSTSCDVLRVEVLAILQGLKFTWDSGFRLVVCETDSLEAFLAVSSLEVHHRHSCLDLLHEIRLLVSSLG